MHPRIGIIVLAETLDSNPPKSRISVIQGAIQLLQLISSNPDGCTFLRGDIDKRYIDILARYLTPFKEKLGLIIHYNSLKILHITNLSQATFSHLSQLLQKELFMEKLVKEAETRVGQSYKKIIEDLKQENQNLLQLLSENKQKNAQDIIPQATPKPAEVKAMPMTQSNPKNRGEHNSNSSLPLVQRSNKGPSQMSSSAMRKPDDSPHYDNSEEDDDKEERNKYRINAR